MDPSLKNFIEYTDPESIEGVFLDCCIPIYAAAPEYLQKKSPRKLTSLISNGDTSLTRPRSYLITGKGFTVRFAALLALCNYQPHFTRPTRLAVQVRQQRGMDAVLASSVLVVDNFLSEDAYEYFKESIVDRAILVDFLTAWVEGGNLLILGDPTRTFSDIPDIYGQEFKVNLSPFVDEITL